MSGGNVVVGVVVAVLVGGGVVALGVGVWFGVVHGLTTPYERKQHRLRQEAKRKRAVR